jgi:acyl dehydratase
VEEEKSLITDELLAKVGVKVEGVTVTVREADAHRMRDIVGDKDPRYADGTGIAPPYIVAVLDTNDGMRRVMPRVLPGGLLTQNEWTFHRPFRIGETLSTTHEVLDIRERLGGRYGHSVLLTFGTNFTDSDGVVVARASRMVTQFDNTGGSKSE